MTLEKNLQLYNNLTFAISYIKYQQTRNATMIQVITDKSEDIIQALYLEVSDKSRINNGEYVLAVLANIFGV